MTARIAGAVAVIGAGMASAPHLRSLAELGVDVRWGITRSPGRLARCTRLKFACRGGARNPIATNRDAGPLRAAIDAKAAGHPVGTGEKRMVA